MKFSDVKMKFLENKKLVEFGKRNDRFQTDTKFVITNLNLMDHHRNVGSSRQTSFQVLFEPVLFVIVPVQKYHINVGSGH